MVSKNNKAKYAKLEEDMEVICDIIFPNIEKEWEDELKTVEASMMENENKTLF